MFTAIISVLGINFLTSMYKSIVSKYGDTRVHLFVFVLSVVATVIWSAAKTNPSLMAFLEHVAVLGVASIGTYEVIWKQIGSIVQPSV